MKECEFLSTQSLGWLGGVKRWIGGGGVERC